MYEGQNIIKDGKIIEAKWTQNLSKLKNCQD